jgi:hypothetical protein
MCSGILSGLSDTPNTNQSMLIDSWSESIGIWFSPHHCILGKEWASFGTPIRSLSLKTLEMQSSRQGRRRRHRFRLLPWLRLPSCATAGAVAGFPVRATTPAQAAVEIIVEGPFATRKALLAGDPRGFPAGARREAGRRRGGGSGRGPRSVFSVGSFGKSEST